MIESLHRDARELTELLTQQRDLYRELKRLAESQTLAISDDEPESLLRILGQRQRLIHELTQVNTLLEPFRSRWDQLREGLQPAQRLKVSDLVDEVGQLLSAILQQDEGDCQALEKRSGEVKSQAASLAVGGRMNAAYAMRSYQAAGPQFIDRRDESGGSL